MKYQLLALLLVSISTLSHAEMSCEKVLATQSPAVKALVNEDGWKQWMLWEEKQNFKPFVQSSKAIKIHSSLIPRDQVDIEMAPNLPEELRQAFLLNGDFVRWTKHPFNESDAVSFDSSPENGLSMTAYFTSSRSLALDGFKGAYTLKMPTDHPHGTDREAQPSKAQTRDDIDSARVRSEYVDMLDGLIGVDPQLIITREILTIADKKTGDGLLVRDISFMKDGNYYLPALSLPYVGRQIALLNKEKPEVFWAVHYAQLLGRAKAKLLLRYGLQMLTPNAQNMLIQLDRNLKPTGVMIFRDISDSYLVRPVAEALGEQQAIVNDMKIEYAPHKYLNPFWTNSAWRMDEAGDKSYAKTVINQWGKLHDLAYKQEIEKALGVQIPLEKIGGWIQVKADGKTSEVEQSDVVASVEKYLFSDEGRLKVQKYHQTLADAQKAKQKKMVK